MRRLTGKQRTLLEKLSRPTQRRKSGYFFAEGRRAVEQILQNDHIHCEFILLPEKEAESLKPDFGTDIRIGEPELLKKLSDTQSSQQIFAVCREPDPVTSDEMVHQQGLIVALDAVQDPGNVGTIYRTAAWFGAAGWIHGKGTVDLYQPKVVRSTAGATGSIPVCSGDLSTILIQLREEGWQVNLLDSGSDTSDLPDWKPSSKQIVVICNEGHGPSENISDQFRKVRIPGADNHHVESLNASVSAGIVMNKWFEQQVR